MKILQRYLTINLCWVTLSALLVLVSLFAFFSVIDQLELTGRGNYGVGDAMLYVLLTTPRLAYDLFPIAAVIGGMAALGVLAHGSELTAIRCAGVSRLELSVLLAKAGFLLIVGAVITGELIAPVTEELAQQRRSMALSDRLAMNARNGFWGKDGNSFVNVRKILPDNRVEELYIYEFDEGDQLRSATFAAKASYAGDRWLLEDLTQTEISESGVSQTRHETGIWESELQPALFNSVIMEPQRLTLKGLYKYVEYLEQNAEDTSRYEQAIWTKFTKPFAILTMLLLAIPLVRTHSRQTPVARQIFFGALAGIVFHIVNQITGHLGIVYHWPALPSVALPTGLLLVYVLHSLRAKA
jgi:lipopolysaccharide export system permease protein